LQGYVGKLAVLPSALSRPTFFDCAARRPADAFATRTPKFEPRASRRAARTAQWWLKTRWGFAVEWLKRKYLEKKLIWTTNVQPPSSDSDHKYVLDHRGENQYLFFMKGFSGLRNEINAIFF
jgi:hypothetical protein